MAKTEKHAHAPQPQMVALIPGTRVLDINGELNPLGEIQFSAEPAFVLVFPPDGSPTRVLGLLDHEFLLGVHKHKTSAEPHACSLLPPDLENEALEQHVMATFFTLFAPLRPANPQPAPAPSPLEVDVDRFLPPDPIIPPQRRGPWGDGPGSPDFGVGSVEPAAPLTEQQREDGGMELT